jgi:hypothetical protein
VPGHSTASGCVTTGGGNITKSGPLRDLSGKPGAPCAGALLRLARGPEGDTPKSRGTCFELAPVSYNVYLIRMTEDYK